MSRRIIYVVPVRDGWRVKVSGLAWDYAARQDAVDNAERMAQSFAEATGSMTLVRVQEEPTADLRLLRAFGSDRDSAFA